MRYLTTTLLLLTLTILPLSGCDKKDEKDDVELKTYQHSIFSFGTIIDVSIYGVDKKVAESAFEQLEDDFQYMHTTWHPWQRSALSRDNQLMASTEWFSDAPSVRPLLKKAKALALSSDHLFNPAIGKLISLWGFNRSEHETGIPPADEAIQALIKSNPRMDDIEFKEVRMRSNNPDVVVDLGGFAKGYGINRSMESLVIQGIENAVINAGGDLKVIGRHGSRPWRIGIHHPRSRETVLAYLDVEGSESVFTSGDYERFYEYEGKRYHHIIDPRTGYPATGSQSVTVIHEDAAVADAAATALFVAGPDNWHKIAQSMGVRHVLLVDALGNIHISPAMNKRIHFKQKPAKIVISKPVMNPTPGQS